MPPPPPSVVPAVLDPDVVVVPPEPPGPALETSSPHEIPGATPSAAAVKISARGTPPDRRGGFGERSVGDMPASVQHIEPNVGVSRSARAARGAAIGTPRSGSARLGLLTRCWDRGTAPRMNATAPTVDVPGKTVTHEGGRSRCVLSEDSYTVLVEGVPVGRVVYSFGAANPVVEGDITEESLTAIGEAWFAAIES